uniref:Uncharacterized protein n=1 Tax=Malurus cyaneus samueli TaxID=2593467 RepID=A0A8C5T018_9PASS
LHAEDNTRFCQKDDNEQTSFSDHNPRHEPKGGFRSSFPHLEHTLLTLWPHKPHHVQLWNGSSRSTRAGKVTVHHTKSHRPSFSCKDRSEGHT